MTKKMKTETLKRLVEDELTEMQCEKASFKEKFVHHMQGFVTHFLHYNLGSMTLDDAVQAIKETVADCVYSGFEPEFETELHFRLYEKAFDPKTYWDVFNECQSKFKNK
jgi:hypothetical protein